MATEVDLGGGEEHIKPRAAHEVVRGWNKTELAEGLLVVRRAIDSAMVDEAAGQEASGYTHRVSVSMIKAAGLNTRFVEAIAPSEIDPEWVLTSSPDHVQQVAGILVDSRVIASTLDGSDLLSVEPEPVIDR